ncbi:hypothetical protein [Corynebacterium freneyi]|uniref:SMI1/KNR4 family protein n=1 Tax=Corynebacterium freneyi TaxID=134034 RepID=A0ABS4U544_9CORY|nr:hypothetical protein [Corynebacterium freneyi]MBP2331759.1 hypothetical protein [Corynebacterium freneyi]QXA51800.1 hypothetical protein I6L56_06450 [Corynebacterium freneyi]UBI01991.1 hypothetical protein LA334_10930 [Corynebacterium freneyi]
MDNARKVEKILEEYQLELPEEYVGFLSGFNRWVRAELDSRSDVLTRDDWAFPGVDFLAKSVDIQGVSERPWFNVLGSYLEAIKARGGQMRADSGLVLEEDDVLKMFAFAEDEGDLLCFDMANNFKVALFLHEEARVVSTEESFADILSSLDIFYQE